jgi:hypothetical protein
MALMSPLTGLRIFAAAITLVLVLALLLPKGATDFLLGLGIGLSVGLHACAWNKELACREKRDCGETVQMNLGQR